MLTKYLITLSVMLSFFITTAFCFAFDLKTPGDCKNDYKIGLLEAIYILRESNRTKPEDLPLADISALQNKGAFRVPQGDFDSPQYSGLNYGGRGLTYNPQNNSLFHVGYKDHQLVAEISIPMEVSSSNIEDLNTASVIQHFADPTEGHSSNIGEAGERVDTSGELLGGFLVQNDKLICTAYGYYDSGNLVKLSHYISGLDLSIPGDFRGMYQVGEKPVVPNPGFIDGYMANIPDKWQSQFGGPALTGNSCLSIISRTSLGPAVSVFFSLSEISRGGPY